MTPQSEYFKEWFRKHERHKIEVTERNGFCLVVCQNCKSCRAEGGGDKEGGYLCTE